MPSVMDVFTQVCTHRPPLIEKSYHRNISTSLKYLASAYGTTPEKLTFSPAIEASYREQLRTYFDQHPKGRFTVRNTLNYLAKLWKAFHQLDQAPPVPPQLPRIPRTEQAIARLQERSPYRHLGWLNQHGYRVPPEQWPGDISARWDAVVASRAHEIRPMTAKKDQAAFAYYVSYQLLSPDRRLATLPDAA